jgi:hypothetical protein
MIETHYLPDWRWGGGLAHGLRDDLIDLADATNDAALLVNESLVLVQRAALLAGAGAERPASRLPAARYRLAEDWFAATVCYQDQLIVAYVRACTQFAAAGAAVATARLADRPIDCEAVKAPALPSTLLRKPHSVVLLIEAGTAERDPELAAAHQDVLDAVETINSCGHYHPEVFDDPRLLDERHGGPLEVDGLALGQALHRYAAGCLSTIALLTATLD